MTSYGMCSIGYSIPTIALCFGVLLFVSGSSKYRKCPPGGSMISVVLAIFWEALWGPTTIAHNSLTMDDSSSSSKDARIQAQQNHMLSLCKLPPHWLDRYYFTIVSCLPR